jgi:hypothetical protein
MINNKVEFCGFTCSVEISMYPSGNISVTLNDVEDGCPVATATINTNVELPSKRHIVIKNYSENEGILEALEEAGIVRRTGGFVAAGFGQCPVVELQLETSL